MEDHSAAALGHRPRDALRHEERPFQVRGDDRVPVALLHLQERGLVVDAGVVDEDVDPRPALERRRDDALDVLGDGDVGRVRESAPAEDDGLLEGLEGAAHAHDVGALGGETLGDGAPDSAAGAGHDHALAVEAGHQPFTAPAVSPRMKKRCPKR